MSGSSRGRVYTKLGCPFCTAEIGTNAWRQHVFRCKKEPHDSQREKERQKAVKFGTVGLLARQATETTVSDLTSIQLVTLDGFVITAVGDGSLWMKESPVAPQVSPYSSVTLQGALLYAPHVTLAQLGQILRTLHKRQKGASEWLDVTERRILLTLSKEAMGSAASTYSRAALNRLLRYGFVVAPSGLGVLGIDDSGKDVFITDAGKFALHPEAAHYRSDSSSLCDAPNPGRTVVDRHLTTCLECQRRVVTRTP